MDITIKEMNCAECDTKLRGDSIQCFKRIHGKPQRVCVRCFEKKREKGYPQDKASQKKPSSV